MKNHDLVFDCLLMLPSTKRSHLSPHLIQIHFVFSAPTFSEAILLHIYEIGESAYYAYRLQNTKDGSPALDGSVNNRAGTRWSEFISPTN